MKHLYLVLICIVSVLSCTSIREKDTYNKLVKIHSVNPNKGDRLIFDLEVGEPKIISMAKLLNKGLYSEYGYKKYVFNTTETFLKDVKWDIEPMFYNDSVVGIYLNANVYDFEMQDILNSLVNLYDAKYQDHCSYDGAQYFFYDNTQIEIKGKKSTIYKDKADIYIKYEKISWFNNMHFPIYYEKDQYGNEFWNYYSKSYKKKESDPALNDI